MAHHGGDSIDDEVSSVLSSSEEWNMIPGNYSANHSPSPSLSASPPRSLSGSPTRTSTSDGRISAVIPAPIIFSAVNAHRNNIEDTISSEVSDAGQQQHHHQQHPTEIADNSMVSGCASVCMGISDHSSAAPKTTTATMKTDTAATTTNTHLVWVRDKLLYRSADHFATHAQRTIRGHRARSQCQKMLEKIRLIQQMTRGFLSRKHFREAISAATLLQSAVRGWTGRIRFQKAVADVVTLQAFIRRSHCRSVYLSMRAAIVWVQAAHRRRQVRLCVVRWRAGARRIQRCFKARDPQRVGYIRRLQACLADASAAATKQQQQQLQKPYYSKPGTFAQISNFFWRCYKINAAELLFMGKRRVQGRLLREEDVSLCGWLGLFLSLVFIAAFCWGFAQLVLHVSSSSSFSSSTSIGTIFINPNCSLSNLSSSSLVSDSLSSFSLDPSPLSIPLTSTNTRFREEEKRGSVADPSAPGLTEQPLLSEAEENHPNLETYPSKKLDIIDFLGFESIESIESIEPIDMELLRVLFSKMESQLPEFLEANTSVLGELEDSLLEKEEAAAAAVKAEMEAEISALGDKIADLSAENKALQERIAQQFHDSEIRNRTFQHEQATERQYYHHQQQQQQQQRSWWVANGVIYWFANLSTVPLGSSLYSPLMKFPSAEEDAGIRDPLPFSFQLELQNGRDLGGFADDSLDLYWSTVLTEEDLSTAAGAAHTPLQGSLKRGVAVKLVHGDFPIWRSLDPLDVLSSAGVRLELRDEDDEIIKYRRYGNGRDPAFYPASVQKTGFLRYIYAAGYEIIVDSFGEPSWLNQSPVKKINYYPCEREKTEENGESLSSPPHTTQTLRERCEKNIDLGMHGVENKRERNGNHHHYHRCLSEASESKYNALWNEKCLSPDSIGWRGYSSLRGRGRGREERGEGSGWNDVVLVKVKMD